MNYSKLKCKQCGKEFERPAGTIESKRRTGQSNFYCSKICSQRSLAIKRNSGFHLHATYTRGYTGLWKS